MTKIQKQTPTRVGIEGRTGGTHNRKTGQSGYVRPIRDSDVIPTAKIHEGSNPSDYGKNLADQKGTSAAGRLVLK